MASLFGPLRAALLVLGCALAACARVADAPLTAAEDPSSDVVVLIPEAAPLEEPPRRGIFAFLRKPPEPSPEEQLADALLEDGAQAVVADGPDEALGPSLTDEEIAARSDPVSDEATRPRLFSFLRKRVPGEVNTADTPTTVMLAEQDAPSPTASLTDDEIAARSVSEDEGGGATRPRFLGFLRPKSKPGGETRAGWAADAPVDSFGLVMRACGVPKDALGTEVAKSPGAGTYTLYDTQPNAPEPRLQYVTGFKDGCPRQFYAALALFGSPVVHETKRYDPSNRRGYSLADDAYERVKGQTCGVQRGAFCPEARLERLGRDVALLTAYPSFGGATAWLDVVLYRGELAGQAIEE